MAKFIDQEEATRHDIDTCIECIRQLEKEMNQIRKEFDQRFYDLLKSQK